MTNPGWRYPGPRPDGSDPPDVLYGALWQGDKLVGAPAGPLPLKTNAKRIEEPPGRSRRDPRDPSREHPLLDRLAAMADDVSVEVIITFRGGSQEAGLPRLPGGVDRSHRAQFRKEAQARIKGLTEQRHAERYVRFQRDWESRGITVLREYGLIEGVLAKIPVRLVKALLDKDRDILYIQPRYAGEHPPTVSAAGPPVNAGRARINSDPYYDLGLTACTIALLDTGVNTTPNVLRSHLGERYNCADGDESCIISDPTSPLLDDLGNHGTNSAAILAGDGAEGNDFRGVTEMGVNSFRVYRGGTADANLDTAAVLSAIQNAYADGNSVIVAEMQGSGGDHDALVVAADAAFDAGIVVIAANGNLGSAEYTVAAPAKAHKAIGVGAYDINLDYTAPERAMGPARATG